MNMTDPEWISVETCLSSYVHYLLCKVGISSVERNTLTQSGTLDWKKLKIYFDGCAATVHSDLCSFSLNFAFYSEHAAKDVEQIEVTEINKTQSGNYIWYKEIIACLAPVFHHVKNAYQKMGSEKFIKDHLINLLWTHNEKVFIKCYELLQNDGVDLVLVVLLMTAAIERALGNVFLLKGKQIPLLLKDLLITSELEQVFGIVPIKLMQIIMGPPLSLNIRNLVWHGFVMPHEMHRCYGYFLLVMVLSLGEQLSRNKISPEDVPERENISLCEKKAFQNIFPVITDEDISAIKQIIHNSKIIIPGFKIYWEVALLNYCQAEFGDCLTLIFPQLESCLRLIYATVNCCPERILTAEVTSLYTTFEEILCLEDCNKVPLILGETHMELLLDLLVYPEGPRARDRISHGEVNFHSIPKHLASHVLSLSVAILCKFLPKDLLPKSEYIQRVLQCANAYWPSFHPKSLLKYKSIKFLESLIAWKTYPQPETIKGTKGNATDSMNLVSRCMKLYYDYLDMENMFWSIDHGFDVNKMLNDIQNSFPKIAYQSKYEKEVINLLRHIISPALATSEQIKVALYCRYKQWTDKQLRSRQRINYLRLLKSVPCIREGLIFVGLIVFNFFLSINSLLLTFPDCQKTMRVLKIILQYVENMKTLTSAERNRWEESCQLTNDIFTNLIQQFSMLSRRCITSEKEKTVLK